MMANMMRELRRVAASMNPVRARAKVLARESRQMRTALIEARRAQGMTQSDVAEMLGVSQQAVQKFERYDADPRLSTLERYANAVGVLIRHRVEEDRGQSIRLAADNGWATSPMSAVAVKRVDESRDAAVEGWVRVAN